MKLQTKNLLFELGVECAGRSNQVGCMIFDSNFISINHKNEKSTAALFADREGYHTLRTSIFSYHKITIQSTVTNI